MKSRLLKILFLFTIILTLTYFFRNEIFRFESTAKTFGDLLVNFHTPISGGPMFTFPNIKPGDTAVHKIDILNRGGKSQNLIIKGLRRNGVGDTDNPLLETALYITLKNNGTLIYGPKPLHEFFMESSTTDGVNLGILPKGRNKTFDMQINFPVSAGNKYQNKTTAFDILFNTKIKNQLIISEVYYVYSPKYDYKNPKNHKYFDKNRDGHLFGQNSDWIEIYNPTDHDVSLKNWSLTDNSHNTTVIKTNKTIKSHSFALISKDSSIWKKWKPNKNTIFIELGNKIGDGLDSDGDKLILKEPNGTKMDAISWGNNTSVFNPSISAIKIPGNSLQRKNPDILSNSADNWYEGAPHPAQ